MESNQFAGFGTVSSIPGKLFEPFKIDSRNLPNSPFSTHLDSGTRGTLSESPEQLSSTENLSGASSSYNSSLAASTYFQQLSPSPEFCFAETSYIHNANNGCRIVDYMLQELETTLMGPDKEEEAATTLQALEATLMGPDEKEEATTSSHSFGGNMWPQASGQRYMSWGQQPQGLHMAQYQPSHISWYGRSGDGFHSEKRQKPTEEVPMHGMALPPENLKQLLVGCAKALSENRSEDFEKLISMARDAVSITGQPIHRLGAYMVEGLIARKEASGTNIYRTLRCKEPEGRDLLSYMHILYEVCPYLKFGYMSANGAIAEACRNEDRVHIIDFQIAQGTQWTSLLEALSARPCGPPNVRITGVDDPVSKYARGDNLGVIGKRLTAFSKKFNIQVEFHAVPVFAPDVTREMLDVRPGEALAVNFPLQLHHTPDESVDVNNPRDGLLRLVKSLSPKVVTLVEQESNTNTTPFVYRFIETLEYYTAMFESLDVTLPRDRKERINVEQHCLARDIVNIIACEGKERVERHELFGKWKSRFTMAGFRQYPLSSHVNWVIGDLLKSYSKYYTLVEKDGAMLLGWKTRNLVSASAWC